MKGCGALIALTASLALAATTAAPQDKVARQRAVAQINLKKVFEKEDTPHVETANLLVFGTVAGKELKDVAESLESHLALARKALDYEKDLPWPGKLAVYLFADRDPFKVFIRKVERRLVEPDDVSSLFLDIDAAHVAASPSKNKIDFSPDGLIGEQIAAALLTKKAGGSPPEWLVEGFGRAAVMQSLPKNELAVQRGKAKQALKKNTARDVYTNNVRPPEDATYLRASLAEYLAFSGKTQVFPKLVAALRPRGENMDQIPTVEEALKTVNVSPDQLNSKWQAWVKFGQ